MAKLRIPNPYTGDDVLEFDPKLIDEAVHQAAFLGPDDLKKEHKAALQAKAMLDKVLAEHRTVATKNPGEESVPLKDARDAREETFIVAHMQGG